MSPAEASHVREDAAGSRVSLTARLPMDASAPAAARSLVRKRLACTHDRGAHVWFEIAARPASRRAA